MCKGKCIVNQSELKNLASTIFSSITEEVSELRRAFEIQNKEFGGRIEEVHREASERDSKLSSNVITISLHGGRSQKNESRFER
jgi:hypothetical protein